jgi:hypothetical protein
VRSGRFGKSNRIVNSPFHILNGFSLGLSEGPEVSDPALEML